MGGGHSKKGVGTAKSATLPPPAPPRPAAPVFTSQAHGCFVDDDGWEVSQDLDGERERSRQRAPFDTPNGGAGVGKLLLERHLDDQLACTDAELSELPPTSLCFEVLEVGGLNEFDTPVAAGLFQVYCVVVVGTVTRVLDSQVSQGVDQTKFYGAHANFRLAAGRTSELRGLSMSITCYVNTHSAANTDMELGECWLEVERERLLSTSPYTVWLRLVNGGGEGTGARVKVSLLAEFGFGTVLHNCDFMERGRSTSPLTASSDEEMESCLSASANTLVAGVQISGVVGRKALISNNGLRSLIHEVQSFNNHTQRVEWMRVVRLQHSFTCAQVLEILQALRYQHEVVQGCKVFSKSVTDKGNLHTLIQAVQAPHDRTEVAEYLMKVVQRNLRRRGGGSV